MQFGKFLAVFQRNPAEPNETLVTAYIALALKARLLEQAKKYETVPILRNLVPAMVLTGKSSFNAGNSISAGLPVFARNNVKAVAAIIGGPRPMCPSCFPLSACQARALKLDKGQAGPVSVSLQGDKQLLEPDLLQPCRPDADPFRETKACDCQRSILRQAIRSCVKGGTANAQTKRLRAQPVCEARDRLLGQNGRS
jgi:hypothetical protein